jgi:GT2 family glycosyltransferase
MKLSIVIICWNDQKCLPDCLKSVYAEAGSNKFEVIVVDNGSTDGSAACVREGFPQVKVVVNRRNVGFGPGNNVGIREAQGDYILILNPDTILRPRALETWLAYADRHPEAGAFGCRTLNSDGSFQITTQPTPTVFRYFCKALCLRWPGWLFDSLQVDSYVGWDGTTDREIGFQAACALLVRGILLKELGGFDERFLHQFEDSDLCLRVWKAGYSVRFCPDAEIVHIGGQNRGRYPIRVILETERSKYKYFHKHYGERAARRIRWISLMAQAIRYFGCWLPLLVKGRAAAENKRELHRVLLTWNWNLDPVRFVTTGEETDVGYAPLITTPKTNPHTVGAKQA